MDISEMSKQELIQTILHTLVTPNIKHDNHSSEDEELYNTFIADVHAGKDATVQLPLDYSLKYDLFELIKNGIVFISNSVKFVTTFTTKKPANCANNDFTVKYEGHEFDYSFLDNHPGIINVNRLKDIPVDYEGLMAVPPTVLEYKNINRFNVHRVIYTPKHNGRIIYSRVVVSNKSEQTVDDFSKQLVATMGVK